MSKGGACFSDFHGAKRENFATFCQEEGGRRVYPYWTPNGRRLKRAKETEDATILSRRGARRSRLAG